MSNDNPEPEFWLPRTPRIRFWQERAAAAEAELARLLAWIDEYDITRLRARVAQLEAGIREIAAQPCGGLGWHVRALHKLLASEPLDE